MYILFKSFADRGLGTLHIEVRGDWLIPFNIFGRFTILCAILRQLHLSVSLLLEGAFGYDVIFLDQLSASIPLLQFLRPRPAVLFYCHFPDKFLASRDGLVRKLWRVPFDYVEGVTTNMADVVVVNSHFTANIYKEAFKDYTTTYPQVIYPGVTKKYHNIEDLTSSHTNLNSVIGSRKLVLSLNRFDPKKNIQLVLSSYSKLSSLKGFENTLLIIAGGYDSRLSENVNCLQGLQQYCDEHGLAHYTIQAGEEKEIAHQIPSVQVLFMLSIGSETKQFLLNRATVLAYTPKNEHFGIVPLEAMSMGTPVLATNTGGPLETIENEQTGWLTPAQDWPGTLERILFTLGEQELEEMGDRGRIRVSQYFTTKTMAKDLELAIVAMREHKKPTNRKREFIIAAIIAIVIALVAILMYSAL